MVPVVNRPVVEHIIRLLHRHGFDDLLMNLHYLGEQIPAHLGAGEPFGVRIRYECEQQLWGDAGSVKRMAGGLGETLLVIGGDALCDTDLGELMRFHRERGGLVTISLYAVADPSEYGVVEVEENGLVTRFLEKPKASEVFSRTANMGMYVLEPEALEHVPEGRVYGFGKDLLPLLLREGKPIYGHVSRRAWRDIGSLPEYRQAHWDALAGEVELDLPGEQRGSLLWIGAETEIGDGVELGQSVMIGRGCRIGAGARLGDQVVIGDDCVIGRDAIVERSILWNDVEVGAGIALRDCLVTHNSRIHLTPALYHGIIAPAHRP
jgi:mannose-1-phosphate guanylyltransferase/phosphomannomutase